MITQDALGQFSGSENIYTRRYPIIKTILYTEGVKYILEHGGKGESGTAHWLLDVMVSWQSKLTEEEFQTWDIFVVDDNTKFDDLLMNLDDFPNKRKVLTEWFATRKDNMCLVLATDGNDNIVCKQVIPYIDFCLSHVMIFAVNYPREITFLLPGEY